MRVRTIVMVVSLMGVVAVPSHAESHGKVDVHLHSSKPAGRAPQDSLRMLAVKLVKSSSLNTANQPAALKQGVPTIQKHYRRVVTGDYMSVTYDHVVKLHTEGGEVSVYEIIVSLARPDYADALFTIDAKGRVVAHEKYSGRIATDLRQALARPVKTH